MSQYFLENNSAPQLTACLLVYNHAHIIEAIIQNILAQSYSDFKFIISDDCSTDNSFEIAKAFETIDDRVTVIKTPKNLGMAGNTNFCFSNINTQFIALLHHDDIIDKTLFESWLNVITKSQNVAFVFNDYLVGNSACHRLEKRNFNEIMDGKKFLNDYLLSAWGSPVRGTALIRKKCFDEMGGMDEKFGMLADVDLWMKLSAKWDVGYVDKPLIEVLQKRPANYPEDYTTFTWSRFFILFDIHSNNINKVNFTNYIHLLLKKFIFRNKVNLEIIKWYAYAVIRKEHFIIKSFSFENNNYELFYSRIFRKIISLFIRD